MKDKSDFSSKLMLAAACAAVLSAFSACGNAPDSADVSESTSASTTTTITFKEETTVTTDQMVPVNVSAIAVVHANIPEDKSSIPLYESPSFKSDTVLNLTADDVLSVLQRKNGWIMVRVRGKQGWLPVCSISSVPAETESTTTTTGTAVTGYVSLPTDISAAGIYEKANEDSDLLAIVRHGSLLDIFRSAFGWSYVGYQDDDAYVTGYLHADYAVTGTMTTTETTTTTTVVSTAAGADNTAAPATTAAHPVTTAPPTTKATTTQTTRAPKINMFIDATELWSQVNYSYHGVILEVTDIICSNGSAKAVYETPSGIKQRSVYGIQITGADPNGDKGMVSIIGTVSIQRLLDSGETEEIEQKTFSIFKKVQ
ncbi:MAG: hypothetical protein MJ071_01830 [Oscillospiraceae bacterium]|nr:hypothetical protein [Oscillospiraceae bacterium]